MNFPSSPRFGLTAAVAIGISVVLGTLAVVRSVQAADPEPALPQTPEQALQIEAETALPITHFYDTPKTLLTTKPGDLLRKEAATEYALPTGASAVRILYHSKDAAGGDVAASAAVIVPAGTKPSAGWPVIVFAHGTSGVARQCAPSAMTDVYYGSLGLFDFVKAGYAIVAVDYHGLGTEGPHQYINKIAQTRDALYSLPAARAAVTSLGSRWVIDGHSQGGLAAWGVAEQEAVLKQPGYLGAIAVAAATLHDGWLVAHPDTTKDAGFYLAWLAYGIQARFPEFQPSDMLSVAGLSHYEAITKHGCWYYGYALYRGTDAPAMVKPDWSRDPRVQKFFAENRAGAVPIAGPLLAIAGESDTAVPLGAVRDVVGRACRNGQQVMLRTYPGLEHDEAMLKTVGAQIAWIKDRFDGKPAPANCPS
jgi:dienelactone hydrolase